MKTIKITIFLTHNCNMSCVYCYEKSKQNISMDMNTANKTYEYICNIIRTNDIQRCCISFHGGEPFLKSNLIDFFINKFSLVNNVQFIYSITTNGTLINDEIISCLLRINDINVSVDGSAKYQRINRPMLNSGDSSLTLENNIKSLIKNNIVFNARMTITSRQVEEIENNIQYLHDLGVKNIICAIEMWNHLWNDLELNRYLINLQKCIDKYKSDVNFKIYGILDAVDSLKGKCMGGINNIIIDYDGTLYPCIVVCGNKEYCTGNIYEDIDLDWESKLEKYNLCIESRCIKCKQTYKCAARRCVFLKEVSDILFNNLCTIQKLERREL